MHRNSPQARHYDAAELEKVWASLQRDLLANVMRGLDTDYDQAQKDLTRMKGIATRLRQMRQKGETNGETQSQG